MALFIILDLRANTPCVDHFMPSSGHRFDPEEFGGESEGKTRARAGAGGPQACLKQGVWRSNDGRPEGVLLSKMPYNTG